MRALITGAAGQDGTLLSRLLVTEGADVLGLVRSAESGDGLRQLVPGVEVAVADVIDRDRVTAIVESWRPDEIYNLAGFSSVGRSWAEVDTVLQANIMAVAGLLEAVRTLERQGHSTRFYQASSSEVYGLAVEQPQVEGTAHHPRSPYAVSKSAAQSLTTNYRESYGLFACSGILYNHESPLRPPHFVTRKISSGVAAIARGRSKRLVLGSLDVARDWGWAPDYVLAMRSMLRAGDPRDFVIASGTSHTLIEFMDVAFKAAGLFDWSGFVESDPELRRPAEVMGLVGDPSAARRELDWSPTVDFADMVTRMVSFDLDLLDGAPEDLSWLGNWPGD